MLASASRIVCLVSAFSVIYCYIFDILHLQIWLTIFVSTSFIVLIYAHHAGLSCRVINLGPLLYVYKSTFPVDLLLCSYPFYLLLLMDFWLLLAMVFF